MTPNRYGTVTQADVARWWLAEAREHCLTTRQHEVLILRFGLFGEPSLSLEETGLRLRPPVSRERVRQLEASALQTLRRAYFALQGPDYHE